MTEFKPELRPLLIGSLPVADHNEALDMVLAATPEIPLWVQLPVFQEEGMVPQFMPGMPGLVREEDRWRVDSANDAFEPALTAFYEDYLQAVENDAVLLESRFALAPDVARGFHVFMERVPQAKTSFLAVKGQVTGPVTFGLGLKDHQDRPVFYDLHTRDAAVKLLSLKAAWQVVRLKTLGVPVIVFVDEPALAGYGSSELISISGEEITAALEEVFGSIQHAGGLAGIHVCANTDWGLILKTGVDVVNFDAYGYAERFLLYAEEVKTFLARGGARGLGHRPHRSGRRDRQGVGGNAGGPLGPAARRGRSGRPRSRRPAATVFHYPELRHRLPERGPRSKSAGPHPGGFACGAGRGERARGDLLTPGGKRTKRRRPWLA